MNKVKDSCYFSVQAWMVTKLKLKTVERDCYAIIYGYSQDGESDYHGSLSYLSELTGYSKNSICTALKNLTDKQLILKDESEINNIKFCKYKANIDIVSSLYGVQAACMPIQTTCTNNINNNIDTNKPSKDGLAKQQEFNFGITDEKPKKKTNQDEYDEALLLIKNFTEDIRLQKLLTQLLDNRVDICGKQRHHFYASTFKNYLDELSKIDMKCAAVELSLRYNSTLKVMKPNNDYYTSGYTNPDTNKAQQKRVNVNNLARNKDGTLKTF